MPSANNPLVVLVASSRWPREDVIVSVDDSGGRERATIHPTFTVRQIICLPVANRLLQRYALPLTDAVRNHYHYRHHCMLEGIEKVKDDPDALTEVIVRHRATWSKKLPDEPEWQELNRRLKDTDSVYYIVGEEEGIVVVRKGEIVYAQLVQDKLNAGLEDIDQL